MQALSEFSPKDAAAVSVLMTDIDDTLTSSGSLRANTYTALERLRQSGIRIIPITGRPAGWCDQIARLWPVDGVVGENGALYFYYDSVTNKLEKHFYQSVDVRIANRTRLHKLAESILTDFPNAAWSADQQYRVCDVAIDYCEDIARLPDSDIKQIMQRFEQAGACAKLSSIHVNAWFGDFDKLTMSRRLIREKFSLSIDDDKPLFAYVGDSPNDSPMFSHFPNSFGVANVRQFKLSLNDQPTYVTDRESGEGFVELSNYLIAARSEYSSS